MGLRVTNCNKGRTVHTPSNTHLTVPDDIQQPNNVRSTCKVLQDLDLTLDLLLLDWLEDFDDAFLT